LRRSLRIACAAQTVLYAAAARLSDHRPWSSYPRTQRRAGGGSGSKGSDGTGDGLLVTAATNRPFALNSALLRPIGPL